MKDGISVVIPAYQEAENLRSILPVLRHELDATGLPYEILVVDTMTSMDDTESVCAENACSYIPRQGGNNYGDAIRTGFMTAQYSYTVVMDGDGSHDPKYIKSFLEAMKEGHDLIIGSRYTKGGNTKNPFILKAMSYVLNVTYRILFGIKVKDVSDSYRMYRTEQIQALALECDNFDIVEEILINLSMSRKSYDIKEVPIYFEERKAGESKRDLGKFIMSYIGTIIRLKRIQRKSEVYATQKKSFVLQNILMFLVLFVLLAMHAPDDFFKPYLWAEDGTVLIQGAIFNGLKGLLIPGNGYLWIGQKLLGFLCYMLVKPFNSIEALPYIQQTLAKILATFSIFYFMSDKFSWLIKERFNRFFVCIALVLLFPSGAVDVVTCETSLPVYFIFTVFLVGMDVLFNPNKQGGGIMGANSFFSDILAFMGCSSICNHNSRGVVFTLHCIFSTKQARGHRGHYN